ncbi:hypothetical protein ACGFYU_20930 [Streptomyces sp. NPDC048337]|uniref:hypothetical protein n=1 Tax=Streptomyces sp. NPDC048337 TaxID=3365535 RepID=UPI0037235BE5
MRTSRPGGTENISVSMPADLVDALRSRTGKRGVSAYVTEAVRQQMAMDGLAEIVAAHETEHGPLTEEEILSAHRELFGEADESSAAQESAA